MCRKFQKNKLMEKRVRILCQKGLLLKSSFLFLSISAMPALAIGGNTLKIDNTDEVVVLQKGKPEPMS